MTRSGLLFVALVAACGRVAPVDVAEPWPASPGDYDEVTESWTRTGGVRNYFDQVLEVHALVRSPSWRAAYVARQESTLALPADEVAALRTQQKSDHDKWLEVVVVATTWDSRDNDLHRGERAHWHLRMEVAGRRIMPASIALDRRPREVLSDEYRGVSDWSQVYVARFPWDGLRGAAEWKLVVTGVRGQTRLRWGR